MRIFKSILLISFLGLFPYSEINSKEKIFEKYDNKLESNYSKCKNNLRFINILNFGESSCYRAIKLAKEQRDFNNLFNLYYYSSIYLLNNNDKVLLKKTYNKSRELALEALNVSFKNKFKHTEDPIIQHLYDIVAFTYSEFKDYENALLYYQKSIDFALENNDKSDEIKYNSHFNMAYIYMQNSDYSNALDTLIKILNNKRCKINTFSCMIAQNNIANVYYFLGDKANEKKALNYLISNFINNKDEIFKSKSFNKDSFCSMVLNARNLKINISKEIYQENCVDVKTSPNRILQLAYEDFNDKRYTIALKNLRYGKTLLNEKSDNYIFDKISFDLEIAKNLIQLNKDKEALQICEENLNILNIYNLNIPAFDGYRNICLEHLLITNKKNTNIEEIIEKVNFYFKNDIKFIANTAPFLTLERRSQFAFQDIYRNSYEAIFSLDSLYKGLEKNNSYKKLLLSARINNNGLIEDIERNQTKLENLNNNINSSEKEELREIYNRLFNPNLKDYELNKLIQRKLILEKENLNKLPRINNKILTIEKLRSVIPQNSIFILFQKYRDYSWKKKNKAFGEEKYKAILYFNNGEIEVINLGIASKIDNEIDLILDKIETSSNFKEVGNWDKVSKIIFDPIRKYFKNNSKIFLSLDSSLNFIPINLLRDNSGDYYSNNFKLILVSSAREFLNLQDRKRINKNKNSIVFANPDFDNRLKNINEEINTNNLPKKQIRSSGKCFTTFDTLENTKYEGQEVARLLKANYFTEQDASSLKLQNIQNSPFILHIATHGFYCEKPLNRIENPLNQVGIVLAGANAKEINRFDDGYLTAMEITKLNLANTEMVVLSSCDSGQGIEKVGDGIMGLRRSLAVAGARSSILSLWKIDDKATSEFMINFYKRLKFGETRLEALLNTQKDFRDGIINSSDSTENWKDEYYWGAFQLSGDWRSINF